MGYNTTFDGTVSIEPPLNTDEVVYLFEFNRTCHVRRKSGPYFVEKSDLYGQAGHADVEDRNEPPEGQPGFYCDWVASRDGTRIEWAQGETFYDSVEWMQYLIDHFLKPGGLAQGHAGFENFTFDHILNGRILAQGEDADDRWYLIVEDNAVRRVEDADMTAEDMRKAVAKAYCAGYSAAKGEARSADKGLDVPGTEEWFDIYKIPVGILLYDGDGEPCVKLANGAFLRVSNERMYLSAPQGETTFRRIPATENEPWEGIDET